VRLGRTDNGVLGMRRGHRPLQPPFNIVLYHPVCIEATDLVANRVLLLQGSNILSTQPLRLHTSSNGTQSYNARCRKVTTANQMGSQHINASFTVVFTAF